MCRTWVVKETQCNNNHRRSISILICYWELLHWKSHSCTFQLRNCHFGFQTPLGHSDHYNFCPFRQGNVAVYMLQVTVARLQGVYSLKKLAFAGLLDSFCSSTIHAVNETNLWCGSLCLYYYIILNFFFWKKNTICASMFYDIHYVMISKWRRSLQGPFLLTWFNINPSIDM